MVATTREHRYGPTSGTVTGWIGLLVCLGFGVNVLVDTLHGVNLVHVRWLLALAAIAELVWAMMLRPAIIVRAPEMVLLRNPFSTWHVPVAAIDAVSVRAVTRIRAGDATYDGVAVGRRIRSMLTGRSVGESPRLDAATPESLADLLTEQLLAAAADARGQGHVAGPVCRIWALPELAALGALLGALLVALLA